MADTVTSSLVPTALVAVTGTYSYDPLFIKIDRENNKSRIYTEDLSSYELVTDSTVTLTTDNKVLSITDHFEVPEDSDSANQYICVIEATKPVNIFSSCVFAAGSLLQVPQSYEVYFEGVAINVLPEDSSEDINCFNAVYVDYASESAYANGNMRENNGTICDYKLEYFTSPVSPIPNLYQYTQYCENNVGLSRPTYFFSSWNASLGDFMYVNTYGVGFRANIGRSEEDSIVRIRLYKTTSSASFTTTEGE